MVAPRQSTVLALTASCLLGVGLSPPTLAGPWGAAMGSVGVGAGGVGGGGGGAVALGWDLSMGNLRSVKLAPTLTGYGLGHRTGGLHQEEQRDATIRFSNRVTALGAELGLLARFGDEKLAGELQLAGGVARSVYVVDGDLDGTELPGVVARDGGLSMSVLAGGVAGVGPLDLLFGLRWRRVPVSGVAVHIVGPTIGLRWGP